MNRCPVRYGRHFLDRKSTRLNSSYPSISYAVFCLKKKTEHSLRFSADREHLFAATLVSLFHGNHGRFVANDSLVLDIDQGVGGPEINRKIIRKDAEKGIEHQKTPFTSRANRKSGSEKITDLVRASKVIEKSRKNAF